MLSHIFALVLVTGFIFMIVWAVRFATKPQLKHVISWFLAIGIVGSLFAGAFSGSIRRGVSFTFGSDSPFLTVGGNGPGGCFRTLQEAPKAGSSSAPVAPLKK